MCCIETHQLTVSKSDPGASPVAVQASAAMRGCLPQPNHASGEDMAWSHGSIASRPIEWQRETPGRAPFPRARARHAQCMSEEQGVRSDARMFAPAKPRIGRRWGLVARIGRIKTHRIAARNPGARPISERARSLCTL